jgi:hypothetical protein
MAWCSKVSDASLIALARCPLYLLYWYKSTNTDRFGGVVLPKCLTPPLLRSPDARFTCFTSTSKKKGTSTAYMLYWLQILTGSEAWCSTVADAYLITIRCY